MRPHYLIALRRSLEDPNVIVARLRKSWWLGPGEGARTVTIAETAMRVDGMQEREIILAALEDLRIAYTGDAL